MLLRPPAWLMALKDPTALSRTANGSALAQQRSTSLPINEFNRALRSHSVETNEDAFPLNGLDETPTMRSGRPRGATTPVCRIKFPEKRKLPLHTKIRKFERLSEKSRDFSLKISTVSKVFQFLCKCTFENDKILT